MDGKMRNFGDLKEELFDDEKISTNTSKEQVNN